MNHERQENFRHDLGRRHEALQNKSGTSGLDREGSRDQARTFLLGSGSQCPAIRLAEWLAF